MLKKELEKRRDGQLPKGKDAPAPEKRREPSKKVETGRAKRLDSSRLRQYLIQVPEDYDPNVAHGLVLWLHPVGQGSDRELEGLAETWKEFCTDHDLILVAPKAEDDSGWLASEAEPVLKIVRQVMDEYTIDPARVVAHGMGQGGQFAHYLGFTARDLVRGVAAVGAVFTGQPKENVADQRLSFFLVAGGKDPLAKAIAEGKAKLTERKFPVVYREIPDLGPQQYLDEDTLAELVRWIDSLDRI
jgi:serine protease Do